MIFIKVLITGGSGGIGSAVAEAFARQGASVFVNYRKSEQKAIFLSQELSRKYGCECVAVKADVKNPDEVKKMFELTGEVDVLVNNAGWSKPQLFTDISDEDWRETMGVNLDGVFFCCREALRGMVRKKSGSIVNISSMWGEVGASCEVDYSAAKAGVIGLTKALAKEVALSNIRVNCVSPGVVMTAMTESFDSEILEELRTETPLQRLGTPEDIAQAVLFLAGENASFITGQVLGVSGGFVI